MEEERTSTTDRIFEVMLDRIHNGDWPVGTAIPSERDLMEEFGVSRIALREALSRLRALGILKIAHGKSSTVAKMDVAVFGQLFPLMLSFEGRESFENVSQVRIALESQTAWLAARHRTEEDVARLDELVASLRERLEEPLEDVFETDLEFHIQIARATQNPLFPVLLEALQGFVNYVQVYCCGDDRERRERTIYSHASIADAIREQDTERARVEMEAHVRFSTRYVTESAVFERPGQQGTFPTQDSRTDMAVALDHNQKEPK